jgi:hypothetical protein
MPFTNSNDYLTGRAPAVFPAGVEVVAVRFTVDVVAGDLTLNNVGKIGVLPAGCLPVDVQIDATDLDTGAGSMTLALGVLNVAGTDLSVVAADGGGAWGSTTAASAAFAQRLTPTAATRGWNGVAVDSVNDRALALKVTAAPATPAAGTIGVTVLYRAV